MMDDKLNMSNEQLLALALQFGDDMVSCFTHPKGPTTAVQFKVGNDSLRRFAEALLAGASPVPAAPQWSRFTYPTKPGVYLVALDPGLHGMRTDRAMEAQWGELTDGWTVRDVGTVVHVTGYVRAWMELPPLPAAPAPGSGQ